MSKCCDLKAHAWPFAENLNCTDFDLAQEYVANFATRLRGPDAPHLAVAHHNAVAFVATLDDGMLAAAKKLKISAGGLFANPVLLFLFFLA